MTDGADGPEPGRPTLCAIVGCVRVAGGAPCAGARVAIAGGSPDHPDIAQVTGETGTYGFRGLSPGRYTIAAFADDGSRGTASVAVDAGAEAWLDVVLGEDGT